jgi:hypothetical protein
VSLTENTDKVSDFVMIYWDIKVFYGWKENLLIYSKHVIFLVICVVAHIDKGPKTLLESFGLSM